LWVSLVYIGRVFACEHNEAGVKFTGCVYIFPGVLINIFLCIHT